MSSSSKGKEGTCAARTRPVTGPKAVSGSTEILPASPRTRPAASCSMGEGAFLACCERWKERACM